MTEDQSDVLTVFDRLRNVGLSPEFIVKHVTAGKVLVDGQVVTEPGRVAPLPLPIMVKDV